MSVNPPEVPPYQLQELIPCVNHDHDHDCGRDHASNQTAGPSSARVDVTCVQALGSEIYLGCSDGTLMRFALQADGPNATESYQLLTRRSLTAAKPIDEIALLPSISRVLIRTDNQLHFYTLPSLDPVPSTVIKPLRNVLHLAVDEQHLRRPAPSFSEPHIQVEPVEFCVIQRSRIAMYQLRERLVFQRELPPPPGCSYARRTGQFLCVADRENYNVINLQTANFLPLIPIIQAPSDPPIPIKPSITVISDEEFLILSSLGHATMGVFITGGGEPVRGTLEWHSYPEAVCMDYPYIVALLPNKTIEIHSLETQSIVQVLPAPTVDPAFHPKNLLSSPGGFLVPSTERTQKLAPVPVPLLPLDPSDKANTARISALLKGESNSTPLRPVFPVSNVLIPSQNSVHSILASTLIAQAEALLRGHRLREAADLADQYRRKLLGTLAYDEDLAEELKFINQRLGFQCFAETLFEDAGQHLLAGEVDPRFLVRYFPELRGNLLDPTSTIDMFAGVVENITPCKSIDEIARNYSPHLSPNTREAPPTAELRRILGITARDMLTKYLRKWRTRSLIERSKGKSQLEISRVVDTVLAKILAEEEDTSALYTLIDEPNDVVIYDVEEVLKSNGQYHALCKLYEKAGDQEQLLEAWSKLVDGIWSDPDIKNPLGNIIELLRKTSDRTLAQRWAVWLIGKDEEEGLKLLISRESKRGARAEDCATLESVRNVSESAGQRYLEHLVLQRRTNDHSLHAQLAKNCVEQLLNCIEDDTTSKLWRAKALSYASNPNESPFLTYFANTTPDSLSKRTRLQTALLLQGSPHYDVFAVLQLLQEHKKILGLEVAILYGKLRKHREALTTLVHDVKDSTSAEAYCTLGGEVVSGKVALALGERYGLGLWATLVAASGSPSISAAPSSAGGVSPGGDPSRLKMVVDEETKKELLKVLLEVYMSGGEATADRTARLLNSQAVNLDVVDVISLVPPDWPISVISSFLSRSFRRTLHDQYESQIVKGISSGQNLEVADRSWTILREQGAVIEEATDDDEKEDGPPEPPEKEYDEKVALAQIREKVAEIRVSPEEISGLSIDDRGRSEGRN